ncbi:LuxR C-terminal-related transcriptional regulator [Arthrobacter sp. MDT3-44]
MAGLTAGGSSGAVRCPDAGAWVASRDPVVPTDDVSAAWPLLHRDREVAAVLAALADPSLTGALIVGEPGQGKTAIAREAAAQVDRSALVVFIRGSAAMSAMPYGALNVLLMELDPPQEASPLFLLQSLQGALVERAGGRPVVLVADNVQYLDESSVMVVSYLAEVGAAHLVVVSDGPGKAPARFYDLWARGRLARVDVRPLDFDTMRLLVEEVLTQPISGTAAVDLWGASRGNLRYLQAVVRGDVESGRLILQDGTWVVAHGQENNVLAARNDAVGAQLAALPGEQRAALELVSVAGAVPLDTLLRFAPAGILDQLQQAGLCRISDAGSHLVVAGNNAIGERMRRQLATNPPPALLSALQELDAAGLLPPPSGLRVAEWFLDTRAVLSDDYLLSAARLANDLGDPEVALRALQGSSRADADVVVEYARACLGEHRIQDGYEAVTDMLQAGGTGNRAGLLGQRVRLAVRSPDHHDQTHRLAAQFQSAVDMTAPGTRCPDPRLIAGDLAVQEGRFRDVLSIHAATPLLASADEPTGLAEMAAHLILANSVTGNHSAARSVAVRIERSGVLSGQPSGRQIVQENTFLARVLSGHLPEALALTESSELLSGAWDDASAAECLEGCALASAGRGKAALVKLLPSINQLRIRDRRGLLPLADAAAAYARALVGRAGGSHEQGPSVVSEAYPPWLHRAAVAMFGTLTRSLLRDEDGAARAFGILADEQRVAGNHGVELLLRIHAVRLGYENQAPTLLTLARAVDGPLAAAGELLAAGVVDQDPGMLLAAAEAGLELGHLDLAGSAALLSMRLHDVENEPLDFIRAEQIFRATSVPRRDTRARRVLTDRERAFARMAARGATNKEIAGAYHLSVRTVEGHVLKAMTKLGISNRKQLSTVFNP